ncbi:hypothetical protein CHINAEXTREME_10550 [Halobiforma lacisalsi AJ5]|uniref:Membrane-bound metal-dependent hydrolase n=1 Tax=Natronobacterium lacisalsi AJ5 TaxID=358396 RepID=M0L3R3_NATLA|nr:metal-dependent hydrolase [Halobiforma lacisalsi]APW98201.1 hypothetical protein CHINAEXTREME_10550 [Halobiforma lacisalsi AJ5]EMA28186.1 membrane-bound metal-dependent hydrolase [Halobiforma lacisalsi AJ5]
MAELLSHVLVAYVCFTVASWKLDWLTKRWVAVGTIGALLPDLNRIGLFVSDASLEAAFGVPFRIGAIHTLGGTLLLAGVGAVVVADEHRRAFGVLLAGGLSHLFVDALKVYADGAAGAWLYPVTWLRHPTPNLYVSSDPWVLLSAGALAAVVASIDRYRTR